MGIFPRRLSREFSPTPQSAKWSTLFPNRIAIMSSSSGVQTAIFPLAWSYFDRDLVLILLPVSLSAVSLSAAHASASLFPPLGSMNLPGHSRPFCDFYQYSASILWSISLIRACLFTLLGRLGGFGIALYRNQKLNRFSFQEEATLHAIEKAYVYSENTLTLWIPDSNGVVERKKAQPRGLGSL